VIIGRRSTLNRQNVGTLVERKKKYMSKMKSKIETEQMHVDIIHLVVKH